MITITVTVAICCYTIILASNIIYGNGILVIMAILSLLLLMLFHDMASYYFQNMFLVFL